MEFSEKARPVNWRRVALEMLWLAAHALLLGIVVAIVVSVPVIWITVAAP